MVKVTSYKLINNANFTNLKIDYSCNIQIGMESNGKWNVKWNKLGLVPEARGEFLFSFFQ